MDTGTGDDIGVVAGRGSATATPRWVTATPSWVKVCGVIAIVLALFMLFVVVTGLGGPHRPGRHMPSGDTGGGTRWGLLILLGFLAAAGVALNWSWLVAPGATFSRHGRPDPIRRSPW
jgi:hypothetical protein